MLSMHPDPAFIVKYKSENDMNREYVMCTGHGEGTKAASPYQSVLMAFTFQWAVQQGCSEDIDTRMINSSSVFTRSHSIANQLNVIRLFTR